MCWRLAKEKRPPEAQTKYKVGLSSLQQGSKLLRAVVVRGGAGSGSVIERHALDRRRRECLPQSLVCLGCTACCCSGQPSTHWKRRVDPTAWSVRRRNAALTARCDNHGVREQQNEI